eukprot:scaffold2058_cov115-Isochrysis_galbana.AAC.16
MGRLRCAANQLASFGGNRARRTSSGHVGEVSLALSSHLSGRGWAEDGKRMAQGRGRGCGLRGEAGGRQPPLFCRAGAAAVAIRLGTTGTGGTGRLRSTVASPKGGQVAARRRSRVARRGLLRQVVVE